MTKLDQVQRMISKLSNYTSHVKAEEMDTLQLAIDALEGLVGEAIANLIDMPDCDNCGRVDLENYEPQRDESRD